MADLTVGKIELYPRVPPLGQPNQRVINGVAHVWSADEMQYVPQSIGPTDNKLTPVFDPGFAPASVAKVITHYPDLEKLQRLMQNSYGVQDTSSALTRLVRQRIFNLLKECADHLDSIDACMSKQRTHQQCFNNIYADLRGLLDECPQAGEGL